MNDNIISEIKDDIKKLRIHMILHAILMPIGIAWILYLMFKGSIIIGSLMLIGFIAFPLRYTIRLALYLSHMSKLVDEKNEKARNGLSGLFRNNRRKQ